jgi:hypothetical protein
MPLDIPPLTPHPRRQCIPLPRALCSPSSTHRPLPPPQPLQQCTPLRAHFPLAFLWTSTALGFCQIQRVNSMPPLSSYNRFACLEVDTLIESHTCVAKSTEVVQTYSHPPIPDQCSRRPAWERRLPVKYVVAASPGPMCLTVDVEIESTDTTVKRCTQALIDCGATGCFIDIKWAKLNNIPTCPLTKSIPD